jgi:hypothetical protein
MCHFSIIPLIAKDRGTPVIIDIHTHVAPPEVRDRPMWNGRCPVTIENVLDFS